MLLICNMPKHGNDTGLTFTRKAKADFADKFKLQITNIFKYFPELQRETVYVGWIAPRGWARGCCCYCTSATTNRRLKISLQPNERNFTIAHEFTHLLQATKKEELAIPTGEKACDIWALTRLPLDLIDDYPSYIGNYSMRKHWNIMKKVVRELAFTAIEVRKTKRQYIVWLEDEINKLSVSPSKRENVQMRLFESSNQKALQD
jgi:hypothetical protein